MGRVGGYKVCKAFARSGLIRCNPFKCACYEERWGNRRQDDGDGGGCRRSQVDVVAGNDSTATADDLFYDFSECPF